MCMIDIFTPRFIYRMSGLIVGSDIRLPMLLPVSQCEAFSLDVTINIEYVPKRLENPIHSGVNWSADSSRFLLDLEGIGRFMAADGCRVTFSPAQGTQVEDILIFVTGTMLSAILYQRGAFLLHGSAVVWNGRAFIFCGPSGAGKSTLASALCRAGCEFLSDDLSMIQPDATGVPSVYPDGRAIRLYTDSIERLGLEGAVGSRVRQMIDKYHVTPPSGEALIADSVPIGGIYIVADATPASPTGIILLPPVTAAQALFWQSYRRRLALAFVGGSLIAARTAEILTHAHVYYLHRLPNLRRIDETVALLFEHWAAPIGTGVV